MVELVDTGDLKSPGLKRLYRFKSGLRHLLTLRLKKSLREKKYAQCLGKQELHISVGIFTRSSSIASSTPVIQRQQLAF